MIDLDELERLHAEAAGTPYKAKGDWIYAQSVSHKRTFSRRPMAYTIDNRDGRYKPTETATYIVAACNAVPELIAENRALRERVRELERRIAELAKENSGHKRVIHILENKVLGLKGQPIPMEPCLPTCDALCRPRYILQSNRSNAAKGPGNETGY